VNVDFNVLGCSPLAVYLTLFLKKMGFKVRLVLSGRRLGDIPLQPMREDHLELAGIEPGRYSEATYSECFLAGSGYTVRLENPIHICRMTEALEQAAAQNQLEISINAGNKDMGNIIDCRKPTDKPHNISINAIKTDSNTDFRIETDKKSLRIHIGIGCGSQLLIQYGWFSTNPQRSFINYSYRLSPLSQLESASLSQPWTAWGLAPVSPLGEAMAEILLAQHLAATADNGGGMPVSLKLLLESQKTVAELMVGKVPEPERFRSLIYSLDKV
jgi:hypothetical protein